MKNFEKYIDDMMELSIENSKCVEFLEKINPPWECGTFNCYDCLAKLKDYFLNEYIKPLYDWDMVAVDTPILVSCDGTIWKKCYFAKYENNQIYAWASGATSWTADDEDDVCKWEYARLAEEE